VAEERGEFERQRMISVKRSAMLDSAKLYHDLASTIGISLTDLVRKRRELDRNTRERLHITGALETTNDMTAAKNLRQQQVALLTHTKELDGKYSDRVKIPAKAFLSPTRGNNSTILRPVSSEFPEGAIL